MLEITHHQLANIPINRLTEAKLQIIGFGHCAPTPGHLIKRENVIIVESRSRHEIQNQGRESQF